MANRNATIVSHHDDAINDSLWDSPVKPAVKAKHEAKSGLVSKPNYEEKESYEQNLRQELANVRRINETIECVVESLERAKGSIKVRQT